MLFIAITKTANCCSIHLRHMLHKYANEDVSLGSWFIGLDVEHIDDRRLCCGTPPGKVLNLPCNMFKSSLVAVSSKNSETLRNEAIVLYV